MITQSEFLKIALFYHATTQLYLLLLHKHFLCTQQLLALSHRWHTQLFKLQFMPTVWRSIFGFFHLIKLIWEEFKLKAIFYGKCDSHHWRRNKNAIFPVSFLQYSTIAAFYHARTISHASHPLALKNITIRPSECSVPHTRTADPLSSADTFSRPIGCIFIRSVFESTQSLLFAQYPLPFKSEKII